MAAASRERLAVAIPLFFDYDFRRLVQDSSAVRQLVIQCPDIAHACACRTVCLVLTVGANANV